MKRLHALLSFALILVAVPARAQVSCTSSTATCGTDLPLSGGTLTGPLQFALPGGAADLILRRDAAAVLQLGTDVNGAAIAQTVKAHDAITGTNVSGAPLNLGPGVGTGTGAQTGGGINLLRNIVTTTGTTAQTQQTAASYAPTKALSTASATEQTIATVTTTTLSGGGAIFSYTVEAKSATAVNTCTGLITVSWQNVSGTVAAEASAQEGLSTSASSGSLTCVPTVTVATNVVSIKLTPTWATIVPTAVRVFPTIQNNSIDPVVWQ